MDKPISINPTTQDIEQMDSSSAYNAMKDHLLSAFPPSIENPNACYFSDKNKDGKPYMLVYNLSPTLLDVKLINACLAKCKPNTQAMYFEAQAPTVEYPKGSKARLWIGVPTVKDSATVDKMFDTL